MQFQFNTGRTYGPEGQRIVVKTIPEGALFNDLTRGISGFIGNTYLDLVGFEKLNKLNRAAVQEAVMWNYDRGYYNVGPEYHWTLGQQAGELHWVEQSYEDPVQAAYRMEREQILKES